MKVPIIKYKSNSEAYCPQKCNCKPGVSGDGGKPVNSNGYCEDFCFKGYCGNTGAYLSGVDCTECGKGRWPEENNVIIMGKIV